jgi:signal transduction histidine kinase
VKLFPRTIRARITVVATVLTATLLVAASVLMIRAFRGQLTDNLDENLMQRSYALEAVLGRTPAEDVTRDEDLLVQVVEPDGTVRSSSPNLQGASAIAPLEAGLRTERNLPGRGESFRVLTRRIDTRDGPAFLLVGVNSDDVDDPARIVSGLLVVAVPGVVAVLAVLTWYVIGRALGPVEKMRAEMAEISGTSLGRRVREPGTGDEIHRLAITMNETLDRLEDALRRQQRFVADASHELRGPLTRMRGDLEVDLARPELADPAATERRVLEETVELQHLVEDLLQLARSDAGAVDLSSAPVDIDDLVLREARRIGERGRVRVDLRGVSAAQVTGDRDQLGRAVRNVLDNAERHAATTVTVTLDETDGLARLTVADDGAGIPPEQRSRIFERFTRLDEARTRDAGGSGLGLAITSDIVQRHGGTVRLADGTVTQFVIDLPARP